MFDEPAQVALLAWRLDWPAQGKERHGQRELRRGADVLQFKDGLIQVKCRYTQAPVRRDGRT